jgi:hypothetical protein
MSSFCLQIPKAQKGKNDMTLLVTALVKIACKHASEIDTGVDFTNVFRARFLYERLFLA